MSYKRMILRLGLIILLCFVLYHGKDSMFASFNRSFPPKVTQIKALSPAEKEEDLQYCFESLLYGHPAINDYAESFGIYITNKYADYNDCIKSTNDNYEFFCLMNAFMREVPSFHTDLVFPEKNAYNALRCFGSERINSDRKTIASVMAWEDEIKTASVDYQDANFLIYEYIDGEYWQIDCDGENDAALIDVDDVLIDDYVTSAMSPYGIWYDGKYNKLCRTKIVFNDRYGKAVSINERDRHGTKSTKTVFVSLYAETAYWVNSIEQAESNEDFKIDQINDISYIQLNNMFIPTCMELSGAIKDDVQNKYILDLRENYGGQELATKYLLYPLLFSEKKIEIKEWYMPSYGVNEAACRNLFNKVVYKLSKKGSSDQSDIIVSKNRNVYRGKEKNDGKKVAILISRKTGSAADGFVNIVKDHSNVVIIGNNTGGEGLMGTYAADVCPNSRLVFVYMPSKDLRYGNKEYTTKGTAPDIYVSNTIDDYKASRDAVLEEAIQYLNEN